MTARLANVPRSAAVDAVESASWYLGAALRPDAEKPAAQTRTLVLVCADVELRRILGKRLEELRWTVLQAGGGAEALLRLETQPVAALLFDGWLPDLEIHEFEAHVRSLYPEIEQVHLDVCARRDDEPVEMPHNSWRNELLHAVREAREDAADPSTPRPSTPRTVPGEPCAQRQPEAYRTLPDGSLTDGSVPDSSASRARRSQSPGMRSGSRHGPVAGRDPAHSSRVTMLLPEMVGTGPAMREMARLVRLVAPRSTTVLIEGETGTGKERVARALHQLSERADKPFAVLNCAAIPESLLEAELFGHTRGAFTGAVQSRTGRIEAADGGTLLLDEIGEMPVGMQAKMLRFLESGELQRVGGNEMTRVNVRLIAATHQPIEQRAAEGTFRLDLYHRLAVFPIAVPPLRERMEDIPALAQHFLTQLGQRSPRKQLAPGAAAKLLMHSWPGNVRELMHVLERATILAGANPEIDPADVRYRRATRG